MAPYHDVREDREVTRVAHEASVSAGATSIVNSAIRLVRVVGLTRVVTIFAVGTARGRNVTIGDHLHLGSHAAESGVTNHDDQVVARSRRQRCRLEWSQDLLDNHLRQQWTDGQGGTTGR